MSSFKGSNLTSLWKQKAKSRRLENKFLKQRLKELRQSRDSWKTKAKSQDEKFKALQSEVESLKKNDF